MGKQQSRKLKRLWTQRLLPAAVFPALLYDLTYYLRGMFPEGLFRLLTWARPASILCEGLVLLGVVLSAERRRSLFLLLNLGWLILTRLLLGSCDFYGESAVRWAIRFICFFGGPSLLSKKQRDLLCALLTLETAGLLALWTPVGIYAALTGRAVAGVMLSTEPQTPPLVYLSFFGIHRNISSAYYVCAAGLLLYHARKTRAPRWRWLAALFLPLAFCMVALQHSRSNYLAFAALLGLALFCFLRGLRAWPRGRAGYALALCALALCAALVYTGMGAVSDGIAAISRSVRAEPPAEIPAETEDGPDFDAAWEEPAPELSDSRNTLKESATLNGRTAIWKSALTAIREKPSIALIGSPEKTMMTRVNQISGVFHPHMHNILFQQLMTAGVPGLLLCCLFLFTLLRRSVSVLCGGGESAGLQIVGALLLALFVYGVFEPLLAPPTQVASLLFCLSASLLADALDGPNSTA